MERKNVPISIRINGKEQLFKEVQKEADSEMAKAENRTPVSEKVIDFTKKKEERKESVQPFWDDGNREKIPKLPFKKRKKKRKEKRSFSFKSLPLPFIAAGTSALIVGLSFGFMLLTFFTNGEDEVPGIPPLEASSVSAAGEAGAHFPDLQVEVVQGGAFSTIESGNEVAAELNSSGQAAVIANSSEPYYLFVGLGKDRGEAAIVSELYERNGQETYVKPFTVNASHVQLAEEQNTHIENGVHLFHTVLSLAVQGLGETAIAKESIEYVETIKDEWSRNNAVMSTVESESYAIYESFAEHLTLSVEYVSAFSMDEEKDKLWLAQQSLLEAMLAYDSFVQSLSNSADS